MAKELYGKYKNVKVFFRIFPMEKMKWEHVKVLEDKKTMYCRCLQDFLRGNENCIPSFWKFETDGVFYNNSQEEIYNTVMEDVLQSVVKGNNAIVFAYGQTGTGKSLTTSGLHNSFEDRGIACRAISDLFKIKASLDKNMKMIILMSYIETTKFYATDLLNSSEKQLDSNFIKNITIKKVKNEFQALKELHKAEGLREYIKNSPYESHASNGVLTLHVVIKKIDMTEPIKLTSKLHIVDFAGQDASGNFSCFFKSPLEVGIGNVSKTQLEQFLLILCANIPEVILVKQRLNILIQYLSDSLNNYSLLRFIGHIRTTRDDLMVTISMLRFGQLIRGMKASKLKPNVSENEDMQMDLLKEELDDFKKEKDLEAMFINRSLSTNITQERVKHMTNVAKDYLENKTNEVVLLNVTDVNTLVKVFKNMYNELEVEKQECTKQAYEKAYSDALASLEVTKTESAVSATSRKSSKMSRRQSSKSREGSIQSTKGKKSDRSSSSKTQGHLMKREKSVTSLRSQDKQLGSKLLKKTKPSSGTIGKRSSQSKRKSTSSTHTRTDLKKDSIAEEPALEEVELPTEIPTHDEAWDQFVNDTEYNYNELLEVSHVYEEAAKDVHKEYIQEVRKLQEVIEMLELRKDELLQAQMQRHHLQKEEYDEEGNVIISDSEKGCLENVKKIEQQMVECQENVLKQQTELRIALNTCQASKKTIDERFNQFCNDKFSTPLPGLLPPDVSINYSENIRDEIEKKEIQEEEKHLMSGKYNSLMKYDNLKVMMKKQMTKKMQDRKRNKKWEQPYNLFKL